MELIRIIIIEDSLLDTMSIVQALKKDSQEVAYQRVSSNEELIKVFKDADSQNKWDVVVSDYVVPGMSIEDSLATIRYYNQDIPFILISGVINEKVAREAAYSSVQSFISKDHIDALLYIVQSEIREAQQRIRTREMEEALRESEERYRLISELISDYAFSYRVDNEGNISREWTTESFKKLTGFNRSDLDAYGIYSVYTDEDKPRVENDIKQVILGKEVHGEYKILTADKEEKWLHIYRRPVFDKDNRVIRFYGVAQDITERKNMEQRLKEERKLLRTLLDTVPDFIYIKDLDHRFILSNTAHTKARGFKSDEEIIGKTDFDFFPAEVARKFYDEEESVLKTGKPLIDHEQPSYGYMGGFVWASSNKMPIYDEDNKIIGMVGMTRDITDRKEREKQLRYHASLQDNVKDAVISTDTKYNILSWNKAAEEIYGWKAEDVVNVENTRILKTEFKTQGGRKETEDKLFNTGSWNGDIFQYTKDGKRLDIQSAVNLFRDENNHTFGIIAVNRNVTEQKIVENISKQNEALYRTIAENYPSTMIVVVDKLLRVLFCGGEETDNFSVNKEKIINKHISEVFQKELFEKLSKISNKSLNNGVVKEEWQNQQKYYELYSVPVVFGVDNEKNIILFFRNVSQYRHSQQRAQGLLEKLKKINIELEQFTYITSHDLKEPLRTISSYTSLINRKYKQILDENDKEYLQFILDGTSKLQKLINDLLTYSRSGQLKTFEKIKLNDVLLEALSNLKIAIEDKDAEIEKPELPEIEGDASSLVRVFQNLIGNALKFSNKIEKPHIKISAENVGRFCKISISDNGIGIDESFQKKVFIIFQRGSLDQNYEGSGLGLAICKKIIEQHGGDIGVVSKIDEGSTFWFTIPYPEFRDEIYIPN